MNALHSGTSEWKKFWFLPVAAALGYATAVIHIYSLGPFMQPLQQEFGWSRAQISSGITIAAFISALFCIPMGVLVDRVGPRPIALTGVLLISGAYALLGTATGTNLNWIFLWIIIAVGTFGVQATIWTAAVASRFDRSRGLALAITLSGGSVAAALFPVIAVWLIETVGWRRAFPAQAGLWLILVFPILWLCFRSAKDQAARATPSEQVPAKVLSGVTVAEGLRLAAFYKLLVVGALVSFTAVGSLVHFVPILTDSGANAMSAAGIASLIGLSSIVGRLGTGVLLDRFPGHVVGALVCLLPVVGNVLLLTHGTEVLFQAIAAIAIGLTLGSEVDVIAYLASKHFGLKNFGALYGSLVMALAMGTAFGPFAAGAAFDHFGSYAEFLILGAILLVISSVSLATLGPVPVIAWSDAEEAA